jgi:hypothetical protein
MSVSVKVLAYTFPTVCIVMGVLLLFTNKAAEGGGLIALGALFQGLYLAARYRN